MANAGTYYVYILASGRHGTLYIGVTNNIRVRLEQHRTGRGSEFVKKYRLHALSTLRRSDHRKRRSLAKDNSRTGDATGKSGWSKNIISTGPHLL